MNLTVDSRPDAAAGDEPIRVWKWTRDAFHQAAELGLFAPDERLELFEGEIIQKMGENPPHASAIRRCRIALEQMFEPLNTFLSIQSPIVLSDESEPEPDVAVVQGAVSAFDSRHPSPADILLLVEVSSATLAFDRGRKAIRYAQAGINEYWILNLPERRLEAYRMPQNGAYQVVLSLGEAQTVAPLSAPQAEILVSGLLPAA